MRQAGKAILAVATACAAVSLAAADARAQTNERTYESLGVRVVTPGARAVAMGKTFVGVADDATAAASNPAGLSNLFDPEISFEWSGIDIRHRRMVTADPLTTALFTQSVAYPTFASFVTPMPDVRGLRNVTLAVFFNALQRYEEHFDIPNEVAGTRATEGGYAGDMEITAQTFGFGGSVLLSESLSIGGSLAVQRLRNDTDSYEYSSTRDRVRSGSMTHDTDVQISGQFGVLYKPISGLSIGAAFHPGTTFHLTTTIFGVFSPENSPPLPPLPVEHFIDPVQPIEYRIPDRFSVGVGVRPNAALTLLADASFVRYSQRITPGFLIVDFLGQQESSMLEPSQYVFDDVVELHAGAEYRFVGGGQVFALRAGVFTDPNHQMQFDPEETNPSPQANGQRIRFNSYVPGTAVGVTGGGGVVLFNRVQLDAAFSVSPNERELVLSTVVRFPR